MDLPTPGTIGVVTTKPDRRITMLQQGQRLLLERGYTATSVDTVCEAAGVTKGAFFHHFNSKEDFGSAVLGFTWQPVLDEYNTQRQEVSIQQQLVRHITFMAGWITDTGRLMPMLAQELGSSKPEIRTQVGGYFARWMSELETLLETAVAETGSATDVTALKQFIIATTEGVPVATSQFGESALPNVTKRLVTAVLREVGLSDS